MSSRNRSYALDMSDARERFLSCVPLTEHGRADGAQRTNADGLPLWRVQLLETVEGGQRPAMQEVQVASRYAPAFAELTEVELLDPTLSAWSMQTERGGTISGVSLRASGLRAVSAASGVADA